MGEKVIVVPISWRASARHEPRDAGVKASTSVGRNWFPVPIEPVCPITVMVKGWPTVGVDGLMTTESTLLALASRAFCTDVNEKFWLLSKAPEAGGPLNT